jgi:hypothetical protein
VDVIAGVILAITTIFLGEMYYGRWEKRADKI